MAKNRYTPPTSTPVATTDGPTAEVTEQPTDETAVVVTDTDVSTDTQDEVTDEATSEEAVADETAKVAESEEETTTVEETPSETTSPDSDASVNTEDTQDKSNEELPEPEESTENETTPKTTTVTTVDMSTVATPSPYMTFAEVNEFLAAADSGTIEERLATLSVKGPAEIRILCAKLSSYNEDMFSKITTPDKGAANNYDLYNTINSVINTESYQAFRVKFDIINMAFKAHAKEAFGETMLHRFDDVWAKRWGKVTLTTYQNLVTTISMLSDRATRQKQLSVMSLDLALNPETTAFTTKAIENLKQYYTV